MGSVFARRSFNSANKSPFASGATGYGEKYDYGENWQDLTARAKARDNWTCQKCGWRPSKKEDRAKLHSHHIIELSRGGKNVLSNLTTLCVACHGREHKHMHSSRRNRWKMGA